MFQSDGMGASCSCGFDRAESDDEGGGVGVNVVSDAQLSLAVFAPGENAAINPQTNGVGISR